MRIPGPWDDGFALDFHTVGSALLGHDDAGHPVFDTRRTELGEALYRLKYRGAWLVVPAIADVAAAFVRSCGQSLDVVVPAVPTRDRPRQPLFDVADALGIRLGLPVDETSLRKARSTPELKNLYGYDERLAVLEGAHVLEGDALRGRRILLVDDLVRSGATLNAVTRLLKTEGGAAAVFVLALTRTRSNA
jgi:predicted amidophosphoribosyltransferase